jgi:hypothetical protein
MTDDPQRGNQRDPVQGTDRASQPGQGRDPRQGSSPKHRASGQGTATMSREERGRQAPPRQEYREPHRSRLPIIAGLLGVLALGGLIAGLVVSHTPSTPTTPTPAPTTRTLSNLAGRGDATAPSFATPSTPITARYSYTCPAGTTGSFVARFETSNGSAFKTIVDSTALSGSGATTVHAPPPPVGSPYHVAVGAPSGGCTYHIVTTTT